MKVYSAYNCTCFTGETGVLTAESLQKISELTPGTPVISVPDSDVKTPSRLRRIARKITTTVGRITLVTVLAGGTTASFEATPGHNVALSSGKFVPVSALTTKDCLHTFDGQLALSLTEGCARVVSLTTRDGTFPVYDLEVEEDHEIIC